MKKRKRKYCTRRGDCVDSDDEAVFG
ncbi:hypothetical protein EVA_22522, partial [gut metagenome]